MSDCTCNKLHATNTTNEDGTCPAVGYQRVAVCVPVTVTPYAKTGDTVTKCCGDPVFTPGNKPCAGSKNEVCMFTLSQTICVAVPVNFGADADVGDTYVNCLGASAEDICMNCTPVEKS